MWLRRLFRSAPAVENCAAAAVDVVAPLLEEVDCGEVVVVAGADSFLSSVREELSIDDAISSLPLETVRGAEANATLSVVLVVLLLSAG